MSESAKLKAFCAVVWVEWKLGVGEAAMASMNPKYKDGEVIVPFQIIVARDEAEARMRISREIPSDALSMEYRVEVAVCPF